ncbi:response regulator [Gemmobacter lanyuensis]
MEAEVAAAPHAPPCPNASRAGAGERPLHILIAEDNQVNRILLVRQLERYGHVVTAVCDGQEALETGLAQPFDIVLMDVSMPRMDGLTASRLLRERGLPKTVPIFAVTAQAQPDRVHQFKAAGMTEVVTKPVNIDALNRLMQQRVGPVSPMQELRMPAPPLGRLNPRLKPRPHPPHLRPRRPRILPRPSRSPNPTSRCWMIVSLPNSKRIWDAISSV